MMTHPFHLHTAPGTDFSTHTEGSLRTGGAHWKITTALEGRTITVMTHPALNLRENEAELTHKTEELLDFFHCTLGFVYNLKMTTLEKRKSVENLQVLNTETDGNPKTK